MPRDQDNKYEIPVNWDGVEHPLGGNQADWAYAVIGALNERLAVHGGSLELQVFDQMPVLNSYMFFQFAQQVEHTILGMLGNPVQVKASNGDVLRITSGGTSTSDEKWNGWLNPDEPMVVGEDNDTASLWVSGPLGYISYNFLDGKRLLNIEGCDFREPLTSGFSSLETCFQVWYERVKNAINKLHLSPVPVNWALEYYYGDGYYSNYDDESMGGGAVDSVAWSRAVSDYGRHGLDPLPDGDSSYYYPEDKYRFYLRCYTVAERRKIDKAQIPWADWTYRSEFNINGSKVFVKRLRGDCPFGCDVYIGGVSSTGTDPNGGQVFDEFDDPGHGKNTLFTVNCGRVLASDPYRYIDGAGWTQVMDDTGKPHPPYSEPVIEPGEQSARVRTVWGHDIEGRFYADWAAEDDGFQFKEGEDEGGN